MLSLGFSEVLATSGFAHRAQAGAHGTLIYRLADGSGHVLVRKADWDKLHEEFAFYLSPIRARTRRMSIILMPAIFLFGMTLAQFLPYGGALILAALFLGPIAIYLWQSQHVKRLSTAMESKLATFPPSPAPQQNSKRVPRWVDVAILLFVGPHLLISAAGEIGGSELFRGTPLSGSEVGIAEIAGFALLALRLAWPRIGTRRAHAQRFLGVSLRRR